MIVFITITVVIIFVFLIISWFEHSNVYFPKKKIEVFPDAIGLSYKNVYFNAADGIELHGWFLPSGKPHSDTFLFFHGNAGNIGDRVDIVRFLNSLGVNVFIFDYRGYGNSKGIPSENGTYLDAAAAYEKVLEMNGVHRENIILYGRSLGGAVAIDLALKKKAKGLIIDGAFSSTGDMAKDIYSFLPVKVSLWVRYDSMSKIGKVKMPKLIIHSADDEIVPFHHGKELFEEAADPKEFYRMRGEHSDAIFMYEDEYKIRLERFLKGTGV
ncbi:MAG: alpha/beta hydrolase [Candidatus Aadella gelida]|nr:alpha/beta hydrolase [Candidatus Aadella gelida]